MAADDLTLMDMKTWEAEVGGGEEVRVLRKPDGCGVCVGCDCRVEEGEGKIRELENASRTIFGWEGGAEEGIRSAKRTPMSFSDENTAGDCSDDVRVKRTRALP
jgi:hypothetical protein